MIRYAQHCAGQRLKIGEKIEELGEETYNQWLFHIKGLHIFKMYVFYCKGLKNVYRFKFFDWEILKITI